MKRAINSQLTRIALIQMRCGVEPEKNLARAIKFTRDAARQSAEVVCLPELFRSQYFCQTEDHKNFDLAEEVPGNSTTALGEVARETIQRGHAIANGCYIAVANRAAHEAPAGGHGIEFWGQSFVCGPDGEIIAKGSIDQEETVAADIHWARVNEHRTHWPFLRDRRIDAYAGIEERMID